MQHQDDQPMRPVVSRRMVLAMGGGAAVAAFLASCSSDTNDTEATTGETTGTTGAPSGGGDTTMPSGGGANAAVFGGGGGDGTIKIGFTAPVTGALAGFGEANDFILGQMNELAKDGLMLGDKSYAVEVIFKDIESNSDTAASRASELILDEGVDLILSIATPEMINPVADQCEANGVP